MRVVVVWCFMAACLFLVLKHVLLQAIARVNRPYEDPEGQRKPCGFVLDFVGIFDKLEKALAFDSKDVEGVGEGMDVLKERFQRMVAQGREEYLPIAAGRTGDKAVEAILEHSRDQERREELYAYFREEKRRGTLVDRDLVRACFANPQAYGEFVQDRQQRTQGERTRIWQPVLGAVSAPTGHMEVGVGSPRPSMRQMRLP